MRVIPRFKTVRFPSMSYWKKKNYGPRILFNVFPLDDVTHFFLFGENLIFFFLKKDLELPIIFVLFSKGKQNRKEKP